MKPSEKQNEVAKLIQQYTKADAVQVHRGNARALAKELDRITAEMEALLGLREYAESYKPIIIKPREKGPLREACANLLISDIHPEEVIKLESVNGDNEFNPAIAKQRIERLLVGFRWYMDTVRHSHKVRDLNLWILGDLISNTIHPDLAESVAMLPADAMIFAYQLLCTIIDSLLLDLEFERINIPCTMGNHDRMTPKIRHQTKAGTSLATVIYFMLFERYGKNERIHFDIARSNMAYLNCYGHEIRGTHGDDFKYQGGIGGIAIPIRRKLAIWNRNRPAFLTVMGHWHCEHDDSEFIVNGSVIGYSAYSQSIGVNFRPPAQVAFLLDKARGKRFFCPIQIGDKEQWS